MERHEAPLSQYTVNNQLYKSIVGLIGLLAVNGYVSLVATDPAVYVRQLTTVHQDDWYLAAILHPSQSHS